MLNAIIDFNSENFNNVLDAAINQFGMQVAITEIAYGLLRRIGLLWLTNHIIPAQEHFASNLIKSRLIQAIEELPQKQKIKQIIQLSFLLLPGEFHEIPLLFIHFLFKQNQRMFAIWEQTAL
jgi:hypothetical protein